MKKLVKTRKKLGKHGKTRKTRKVRKNRLIRRKCIIRIFQKHEIERPYHQLYKGFIGDLVQQSHRFYRVCGYFVLVIYSREKYTKRIGFSNK